MVSMRRNRLSQFRLRFETILPRWQHGVAEYPQRTWPRARDLAPLPPGRDSLRFQAPLSCRSKGRKECRWGMFSKPARVTVNHRSGFV